RLHLGVTDADSFPIGSKGGCPGNGDKITDSYRSGDPYDRFVRTTCRDAFSLSHVCYPAIDAPFTYFVSRDADCLLPAAVSISRRSEFIEPVSYSLAGRDGSSGIPRYSDRRALIKAFNTDLVPSWSVCHAASPFRMAQYHVLNA